MKIIILLVSALGLVFNAGAQNKKGFSVSNPDEEKLKGKTYALICGISNYKHIPKLYYAADDARMFAQFLQSESGGKVDDQNIRLITDEQVTAPAIIVSGFGWIASKNPQKGDRVYIYFSGHGDAISPEESFLLMSDADPAGDKNMYAVTGALQVFNLKNRIKNLTAKGIEVILIVDACRTNELPGGQEGLNNATESMIEKKSGEVLFLSASANEYSYEDKRWGNGHGVFTWHLINGLMGKADEDGDGKVTADELQSYVALNVKKETRPLGKVQTPYFCCNTSNDDVLSYTLKNPNDSSNNSISDDFHNPFFASQKKENPDLPLSDTSILKAYLCLQTAIKEKRFLAPDSANADSINNFIANSAASPLLKNKARLELASAFINEAQEAVNCVFATNDGYDFKENNYYANHSLMLRKAMALIEPDYADYVNELKPRLLYLESNILNDYYWYYGYYNGKSLPVLFVTNEGKEFESSVAKDSVINKLKNSIDLGYNKANVYYAISNIYELSQLPDSVIYYATKAVELSPKWYRPYNKIAWAYLAKGELNKGDSVLKAAVNSIRPNGDSYAQIGFMYNYLNTNTNRFTKNSEYFLNKSFQLDSMNLSLASVVLHTDAFISGRINLQRLKNDSMERWVKKLWVEDNLLTFSLKGDRQYFTHMLFRSYYNAKDYKNLKRICLEYLDYDKKSYFRGRALGYLYSSRMQSGDSLPAESFLNFYNVPLADKKLLVTFYSVLGDIYEQDSNYSAAINYYQKTLIIDTASVRNYSSLIYCYSKIKDQASVNYYAWRLMQVNPVPGERAEYNQALSMQLEMYKRRRAYDSLAVCLQKIENSIFQLPDDNYRIAACQALTHNKSAAVNYLKRAAALDSAYLVKARQDLDFVTLRNDSAFIKLTAIDTVKWNPKMQATWADQLYKQGDYKDAVEAYKKRVEQCPDTFCKAFNTYDLSCCYSLLNNKKEALDIFASALKLGYRDFNNIKSDTDLDNIRNEPEFKKLMKKYFPTKKYIF